MNPLYPYLSGGSNFSDEEIANFYSIERQKNKERGGALMGGRKSKAKKGKSLKRQQNPYILFGAKYRRQHPGASFAEIAHAWRQCK